MKRIDNILNRVTMYRLAVYELLFLLLAAGAMGAAGLLAFDPVHLAFSVVYIFALCWITNRIFAGLFSVPYNPESTWITALILALIISPPAANFFDFQYLALAFWASTWAITSKYLLAIKRKHVFNPAALGVAMTGMFLGVGASWWVGTLAMAPLVLAGGLLIVRKLHRFDLWWAFMATFTAGIAFALLTSGGDLLRTLDQSFIYAPVFFLSTVMLTEPATMPSTRLFRILYGATVAVFFLPSFNIAGFYLTPELALLAGNVFAYLVSPKQKFLLRLKEKVQQSRDVYDFVFELERPLRFMAGQYLEWTLPHRRADSRGSRRYFTIASAPEEGELRIGVRFYSPASSFKKALFAMRPGEKLAAAQLAGDFTLPRDKSEKLVFIAGGIGITPFRSMLRSLLARGEKRPITVLYAAKTPEDAVYASVLEQARQLLGINTVYAFSDTPQLPYGTFRRIDQEAVAAVVPDYLDRTFYLSGPQGMVTAFKEMLQGMGVSRMRIRTDYFPGFA